MICCVCVLKTASGAAVSFEAKDATEAKKRSEASFSPLAGTAVYLEVGNTDVVDLARSIRLICGSLERRLDAVRCEIAQARNRIGSL